MSYNVEISDNFEKEIKKLIRKFPSLKNEYASLIALLEEQPFTGIQLGNNCYKIRLGIASKRRGQSGGARVITYVYVQETTVYMISIYDKSEQENISARKLQTILNSLR